MSVPYRAIKAGRVGWGCELSPAYWADGAVYCEQAAEGDKQLSLFDMLDMEAEAEA